MAEVNFNLPIAQAIKFLETNPNIPIESYKGAVMDALAKGHKLNEHGILITGAIGMKNLERTRFLFSIGAEVANQNGLFGMSGPCTYGHVFLRQLPLKIARLVLKNVMKSPHLDKIKEYLTCGHMDLFSEMEPCDDIDVANFFIRMRLLPNGIRPNKEIQELCGVEGLLYPDVRNRRDNDELKSLVDLMTVETKELRDKLAVSQAQLAASRKDFTDSQDTLAKNKSLISTLVSISKSQ